MLDKRALRKRLRAARRALPDAARARANQRLCERIGQLAEFQSARRVATFLPFDGELDVGALLQKHPEKQFFLPVLLDDNESEPMRFAAYRHGDPLTANRYGIPEPETRPAPDQWLLPRQLDVVLTPLVGFDEHGTRLGMGGGYYDRSFAFLNQHTSSSQQPSRPPPYLLGLAFELQKCPPLPRQSWDVILNAVATEAALYRFD